MPEAPKLIKDLVKRYDRIIEGNRKSSYNEQQIREEFLNYFFIALGWDVGNKQGAAPQYRDVIFEDSIKIGGGTRAPDYCFTLSGRRKYFVEAKKPTVNIRTDKKSAFQLRRYLWSAKFGLSILTNFEELSIYGSKLKPKENDSAGVGREKIYKYTEYVEKWDEIYNLISYEAVKSGQFDNFSKQIKGKRGTQEVDDEFLKEIDNWRLLFARNIALRNENISTHEINFAVNQIIDRIIFLRMCEDRGIEPIRQLYDLINEPNIYDNFCDICRNADKKYNSGLFHFDEEKNRNSPPDSLTLDLKIDDKIWKEILKTLYYPLSPYEFSVMPPEILGNAYEQFLGKTIVLTDNHRAKILLKPEVKKAGGVYYTPQYIVNYIVKQTVGKLCDGKTPKKVAKIRILDPACGSGSFLLGAYSYLLDWHLKYYTEKRDVNLIKDDKICRGKDGEWVLTIQEKKSILIRNIYGVDIDPQAVEVTKLSLLLKVLEGESRDVIEAQMRLIQERALPDLDNNIKCGNSLIDYDFYDDDLTLTDEEENRVNAFEWEEEFSDIFNAEKFDAIIGNPPYISIQKLRKFYPLEVDYYLKKYNTSSDGNIDIYIPFIEKSMKLIKENGVLGFICPNRFFNSDYGLKIREFIKNYNIYHLVNFRHYFVFKKADAYTCLLFIQKNSQDKNLIYEEFRSLYQNEDSIISTYLNEVTESMEFYKYEKIKPHFKDKDEWYFMTEEEYKVFKKIIPHPKFNELFKEFFVGVQTSKDDVYILKYIDETEDSYRLHSKKLDRSVNLEKGILKPVIDNTNIFSYFVKPADEYIIFPYKVNNGNAVLYSKKELSSLFPNAWKYLKENKRVLEDRENGRMRIPDWYAYIYPKNLVKQDLKKILIPHVVKETVAAIDEKGEYCLDNVGANGIILEDDVKEHPYYFLALLNNPIASFFISKTSIYLSGGYYATNKQYAGKIPIVRIDFDNKDEVKTHNKIVSLVKKMINFKISLSKFTAPTDIQRVDRQIKITENNIRNEVNSLYGLRKKDIKIIEKNLI
ncbi:MAG: restriction endonuclease subunit M [Methanobacterium sp.]|nr:MAG: restriction endonuclease subunit M [Methanobacterium sp.]